ncbi:DUF3408 domain-containing protein [Bacteroides thetaiotaomicron]|uniref:DUF3408 domain-containing protein n=1 Tax=Bacteroides thetaiotaomicron TaxID=818 RepID=UPI001F32695C|nr:DUF3408 domain-containing protein [Bacteroides thetaiotaomicron]MCE8949658.1 DUF3408 domain-containing protein [Bacteroides thetaiotaomicron]MCE8967209.1 DUF3408 domain-containing protein [Bacteroides thetaiotaomicron]
MNYNRKSFGKSDRKPANRPEYTAGNKPSRERYSHFLKAKEISTRQCVYISREMHRKISRIVNLLATDMTIGGYIDNVLEAHIDLYRDEINTRLRNSKPELL